MMEDENDDNDIRLDIDDINPLLSQFYEDNTLWKGESISDAVIILMTFAISTTF